MRRKLPLDFILSFCRDMVPDHGEDSYCHSFCDTAGMLGVFDGCGGAGARKHSMYSDRTEAYIASRLCAGAFYDSFREHFPGDLTADDVAQLFSKKAIDRLEENKPADSGEMILGSMVRTLPTTVAVAMLQPVENGEVQVSAIWAGDSRVYLLNEEGLAQLTVDDTSVPDPMETLYEDGVLKNIFCSDRRVRVHCKSIRVKPPFVALAATDGCFGYVSTPMEFEGLLLHALLNADTPAQWEELMAENIGSLAGDDHTLCMAAVGYKTFDNVQNAFQDRYSHLLNKYLRPVSELPVDDRQSRYDLWNTYKTDYMRYLEDQEA